ncbi:MAG: septum formation protein Maf [Bacteroidetes bacterium]|nr:MAG: septum formation protein Maf [Bacteroidota bacterium]
MNSTPPFILASSSPRRRELLHDAGFNFDVIAIDVNEDYPEGLAPVNVVELLALRKLDACKEWLKKFLVVTADTLVYKENTILGKPKDRPHAIEMLSMLSNSKHEVATSVCIGYHEKVEQFTVKTIVEFAQLSEDEIEYYVDHYMPFDKAGSYGIQEWIGQVGIRKIEGSYTNVVGLPMHETYHSIVRLSKDWLQ